jgi:hypothetical protein
LTPVVPAKIKTLIGELGLRYRPAAAADLAAHGATLALLARDLCDLPYDRLEHAIHVWVRSERWMPKAADLIALCQRHQAEELGARIQGRGASSGVDSFVDARNASLSSGTSKRKDIEWFVDGSGEAKLRYIQREPVLPDRVPLADVDRYNRALRKYGADFRWDRNGRIIELLPGDPDPTEDDEHHR